MAPAGRVSCKNVIVNGHRTSLRMENELWDGLHEVCRRERLSVDQLCSQIDGERDGLSRTSAVRAFVVDYLRRTAQRATPRRRGVEAIGAPMAASKANSTGA